MSNRLSAFLRPLHTIAPIPSTQMDRTYLPPLDIEHFDYWQRTLEVLASELNLEIHFNPATTAPTDPTEFTAFKRSQDRLSLLILASLPKDVISRLDSASLKLHPHLLLQQVQNIVTELTTLYHSLLEDTARSITFNIGDNLETYIKEHDLIRSKMRRAGYPLIEKEATSLKFMLQSIRNHPDYQMTYAIFTHNPPSTIAEFTSAIRRANANLRINKTKKTPTPRPETYRLHTRNIRHHSQWQKPTTARKWCTLHRSPHNSNCECRALLFFLFFSLS